MAVLASEVPSRQTVPRAELWATNLVAERAQPETTCVNKADANYVVQNWEVASRREKVMATMNGDLWDRLQGTTKERDVDLTIHKVDAHIAPEEVLNKGLSVEDFVGNHLADAAAVAAAERALSDSRTAAMVARWETRVFAIAKKAGGDRSLALDQRRAHRACPTRPARGMGCPRPQPSA